MIEDLGGCTGTLPLYQRAAEVGRAMELFGDRVPPETQRQSTVHGTPKRRACRMSNAPRASGNAAGQRTVKVRR